MNVVVMIDTSLANCTFSYTYLFMARIEKCRLIGSSFANADLTGVVITGGDWSWSNLRQQTLKELDLRDMKLVEADLSGADLTKTDLRDSDLTRANFSGAKLLETDLRGAKLTGADLRTADLKGARMDISQAVYLAQSYGAIVE